jgi:hypothetical protein
MASASVAGLAHAREPIPQRHKRKFAAEGGRSPSRKSLGLRDGGVTLVRSIVVRCSDRDR